MPSACPLTIRIFGSDHIRESRNFVSEVPRRYDGHRRPAVKRYWRGRRSRCADSNGTVFGAPVALEDHGIRGCLAALAVQEAAKRLAVDLQLRVGLNSGQVIAGEMGSGPFGYTTIGEQVGMAQRMESAAPPGGVMLSASTARLVEGAATFGELELVHIKGADKPVAGHRLLGIGE